MAAQRTHRLGSFIACAALVWPMVLTEFVNARTIRVPQDYARIQDAVNWAFDGDEIVVAPGVYVGTVNFMGKDIVLRSNDPRDPSCVAQTIIDGNAADSIVRFSGAETSGCVLTGFTIRNGSAWAGGGIDGRGTKARVEYNVITRNRATYGGGLCSCDGIIQNNTISHNEANVNAEGTTAGFGGGLCECSGLIRNNTICENAACGRTGFWVVDLCSEGGGLWLCNGTIEGNTIANNWANFGGGLANCTGPIQNNLIYGNQANRGGGLYLCGGRNNTVTSNSAICRVEWSGGWWYRYEGYGGGLSDCHAVNSIIWNNSAETNGDQEWLTSVAYCCLYADPRFLDPGLFGPPDFHLHLGSPCIDAGTNSDCPPTDKDGNPRPYDGDLDDRAICDIGAYELIVPPRAPILAGLAEFSRGTSKEVSWGAVPGSTGYWLQWASNEQFAPVLGNSGWTTALSYVVKGLVHGQTYYYRVCCRNVLMLQSTWSGVVSSRQDDRMPTTPGTPRDSGAFTSSTSVRFNWTAATDADSGLAYYDLQVGTSPGAGNVFDGYVDLLTAKVTGGNGQTLYARVRAVDRVGNVGSWSGSSDGITIDTLPPRLANVAVSNPVSLIVGFCEPVRNADQAGSYRCSGSVAIVSALRLSDSQYLLRVSNLRPATTYTLSVEATMKDRAGNPIDSAYRSRTFFAPGADLIISFGLLRPSVGRPGQPIDVLLGVKNIGVCGCRGNWTHVYLSRDQFYDGGDYLWIPGNWVPPLNGDQEASGVLYARIPNVASASYYVIAHCDIINEVAEWDEQNNWKAIGILTLPTGVGRWSLYR